MQSIPARLRLSCSAPVSVYARSLAPSTTSFAGALCTPRVESVRHQMPATWPHGGIWIGRFVIGSMTSIHGQYIVANLESRFEVRTQSRISSGFRSGGGSRIAMRCPAFSQPSTTLLWRTRRIFSVSATLPLAPFSIAIRSPATQLAVFRPSPLTLAAASK